MLQDLYVFDMDETLFDVDCAVLWHEFLVEKEITTTANFREEDARLMALYAQGELDMKDYLSFSIAPLKGISDREVGLWVEQCIDEKIMPRFYPQAKALLASLKRDEVDTVMISASVSFLVNAIAQRIGIDVAMGIDLVKEKNTYTSEIEGVPTYRDGKVIRLKQWLVEQNRTYKAIHFFTDSINDLPLCQYADFVYLVNPCRQLQRLSHQEHWKVLDWSRS
ncbi:HAD-IB family hydrolase [Vibrio sp. ZSDZ65]|uniref:HAD-IB family hydrolase n=1 Tax=Vibrio qingdaonensis TaxID=2829491 RepID=A0A9X3HYD2_9VIBR|nr:HAD family hydrolase [Vibrio qingdaonensis]MCW8348680.1 HAD-IB family hydrolase [Vibrio qingdaonensis]